MLLENLPTRRSAFKSGRLLRDMFFIYPIARTRTESADPTGCNPFALALSPDGKHLYVTNSGLFEYKTVDVCTLTTLLEPACGHDIEAYTLSSFRRTVTCSTNLCRMEYPKPGV